MDKRLILALFLTVCLQAEPQLRLGLGQTTYADVVFPFQANNGFAEYTFNPYSRLQFGLKYEQTGATLADRSQFNARGLLGTFKIYLNTLTHKTPYFGYNLGWINTELIAHKYLYSGRGVFCSEALAGYSFRLNEFNRLNLEYIQQTIENAYEPDSRLRADNWSLSWSVILRRDPRPVRHQTPEEGVTTRKEYLRKKIAYNNEQIGRYDTLITKYDQKILTEGPNAELQKEREFLLSQRNGLEQDNRQMLELLEK